MNRQQAIDEKLRILDEIIQAGPEVEEFGGTPEPQDMWGRLRDLSRPPYIPLEMYIPKLRF